MDTTFLNDEEVRQVRSIMDAHGVKEFDASVRLWGRGKNIRIAGDLGKRELGCLLAVLRYLDDSAARTATPPLPYAKAA